MTDGSGHRWVRAEDLHRFVDERTTFYGWKCALCDLTVHVRSETTPDEVEASRGGLYYAQCSDIALKRVADVMER
jgi:hypothetical protein